MEGRHKEGERTEGRIQAEVGVELTLHREPRLSTMILLLPEPTKRLKMMEMTTVLLLSPVVETGGRVQSIGRSQEEEQESISKKLHVFEIRELVQSAQM